MNYIILKHWHYCLNFIPWVKKIKNDTYLITKEVEFSDDMKYTVTEPSGVNKLFGMCYGILGVHKESDRFGWRCSSENTFDIFMYSYNNGKLFKRKIAETNGGKLKLSIKVSFVDDCRCVSYYLGDKLLTSDTFYRQDYSKYMFGLGPYFGGVKPAPKKITIKMS